MSLSRAHRIVTVLIMASIGLIMAEAPSLAARGDEACWWLDVVDDADLERDEYLPPLGCRLNEDEDWVDGRILADDHYAVDVPRADRRDIENAVDTVLNELDAMLVDRRLRQVFDYNVDTGDLWLGAMWYPGNDDSDAEVIELAGETLNRTGDGDWYRQYEPAASAYLATPGHELLAGYASWYMRWRDSAALTVIQLSNVIPMAEQAMASRAGGLNSVPWPWQLADEGAITMFVLWVIENA